MSIPSGRTMNTGFSNQGNFIERIELTDKTIEVDQVINGVTSHQSIELRDDSDSFLNYDAETDRLVASKPLETTVASLHLKDAHTMSSGGQNIWFTDENYNLSLAPVFYGVPAYNTNLPAELNKTLPATSRTYGDVLELKLLGNPVENTSIDYNEENAYPLNISALGIEFVLAEDIPANVCLKYKVFQNDIAGGNRRLGYEDTLNNAPYTSGQTILHYFHTPLELAGLYIPNIVLLAQLIKVQVDEDGVETELGFVKVQQAENLGSDGLAKKYTKIIYREWVNAYVITTDSRDNTTIDVEKINNTLDELTNNSLTEVVGTTHNVSVIAVTNDNNGNEHKVYSIDTLPNPDLEFAVGDTIVFNIEASGHPMHIKLEPSTGVEGSLIEPLVSNAGIDVGSITLQPTAPVVLYYNCEFHSQMFGKITIT